MTARQTKPPAQKAPLEPPAPRSLAAFAADKKPVVGALERWLTDHPYLRDEVAIGLKEYPVATVWKWLRDEYGFPLTVTSLYDLRDRQNA